MKYEVVPAEKSTVKITMTFTGEEWTEANRKAYLQNRHKYAVNGFRKGKAPKYIIENYYGKATFYEAALNILFQENYDKVLEGEKENFTEVGDPELSLIDDFSETNIGIVAVTPVKPDVDLGAYKGIKIPKYEYTVTDADVEKTIDGERESKAESVDVKDRPAELKDTVNIDFAGTMDGKPFEGGSAEGFDLTLGSGQFIPGFEEGIVGMNIGEAKDIEVTFPEDYQAEELRGKPAIFTVTLHKIMGKKLPALDEEFAKKMGSESVEAYTAKVRERLEKNAATRGINETENAILSEIAKTSSAEIPDAMVDAEEEQSIRRVEYNLMYQGVKLEDYLAYIGTTREEYKKQFEADARAAVLRQLVLEKIIEVEKIEATGEEIESKIAEQAASVGREPEEYKKTMDPRQRLYIENDIKVTKVFEFLMANNDMVKPEENA